MNTNNHTSSLTGHKGGEKTQKYVTKNIVSKYVVSNFISNVKGLVDKSAPYSIHEVGCGEGHILSEITKDSYSVVGSDISENCLKIASKELSNKNNIRLINQNIYELDASMHSADLVICCEVLEHLENPKNALKILSSITKKCLILSVPREPLWRVLNICRFSHLKNLGNTPGHINHWSKNSFLDFVSQHMDITDIKSPLPWTLVMCKPKKI